MLWTKWFQKPGTPVEVHSDSDVRFTPREGFWKGVLEAAGVQVDFSPPRRPQSNGRYERINGAILTLLRNMMLENETRDGPKWVLNHMPSSIKGLRPQKFFSGDQDGMLTSLS